jgi:hypothetical protein
MTSPSLKRFKEVKDYTEEFQRSKGEVSKVV